MAFDETQFLTDVAYVAAAHPYNESSDANAKAAGKLLQAAAAVILGAVDHGWLSCNGAARAMFVNAAGRAFDTVLLESSAPKVKHGAAE